MRKLYYVLFISLFAIIAIETSAQNTYVPDDNFEQALIDLGYDAGVLDDYVPTGNISGVTLLNLYSKNIADLTGIEDFIALTMLNCSDNQLTSLDVSSNTALIQLYCNSNQLTSLDLSSNTTLNHFQCMSNQISSLDVSGCPALYLLYCHQNQLSSLDVSVNTNLTNLWCYSNQLSSIDVSANTTLTQLKCYSNQLSSLDVRNGNNENVTTFDASDNSDLACIYIDDKMASYLTDWTIDATSNFVNDEADCSVATSVDEIIAIEDYTIYPNPTNGILKFDFSGNNVQKIKISDITGKTVFEKVNVEQNEVVDLSGFANGIYVVILQTDKGSVSSKIIKE